MRSIARTLEKNHYLTEQKKQDWLEKALDFEERQFQKDIQKDLANQQKIQEIRRKEFYRETVKKRSFDLVEEKKNATL